MRELSVFCDESGDFGTTSSHAPFYLVSLVFHEQDKTIDGYVERFESEMRTRGFIEYIPVHTAPLIRREERYAGVDGARRRKVFDILLAFARRCDISYKTFVVDKRLFGSGRDLEVRLAQEVGQFIRENLTYFHSFDRVVLYYDGGQKEISRTLELIFSSSLAHIEFKTVQPKDYVLFQVADLACTLELVEARRAESGLTRSEDAFFGGIQRFKRNYLKTIRQKLFA